MIGFTEPAENQVYVTDQPATKVIKAEGTLSDTQTGVNPASVTWTIGEAPQPANLTPGKWNVDFIPGAYGFFELRLKASDLASNSTSAACRFAVVPAYEPATLEELLGPQSYLRDLILFASSYLQRADGSPVQTAVLKTSFHLPFQTLSLPTTPESQEFANEVLVPIRQLRARDNFSTNNLDEAEAQVAEAALVARYNFSELATGATDGVEDRFRGFRGLSLNGRLFVIPGRQAIDQDAVDLTGAPSSPLEDSFRSTGDSLVVIGDPVAATDWPARALALGRGNRDFSLSFWIRPEDYGAGEWRGVVFKGDESGGLLLRTPGIWLHPSQNRIHFCISTAFSGNERGDSNALLPIDAWTHVAYVKIGRRLRLYLNGLLDKEVVLNSADILHSQNPLYLGTNPHYAGFKGALSEFRVYATGLGDEEVRYLAQDRLAGLPDLDIAKRRYCDAAYEALLSGLGTSRNELATIGNLSAEQVQEFKIRLGLADLPGQQVPVLEGLVPLAGDTDDTLQNLYERFLAKHFGLPLTFWEPSSGSSPTPTVLMQRQAGLEHSYLQDDSDPARWPDLDPDLVDWKELNPDAAPWRQLHIARSGQLATKFRQLSNPNLTAKNMVAMIYNASVFDQIGELEQADAEGRSIVEGASALSLDLPMLRQIQACLSLVGQQFLPLQRTGLAHLLVEVWKRRDLRATWVREESLLPTRPWPSVAGPGAWVPGHYRRDFLPWRGSVRRRVALEDRLGERHRAFNALVQDHTRLLLDVQRSTLPRLRDDLLGIGDMPALVTQLRSLQQLLLTDLTVAGALELSTVEQATSSLQVLLNGILSDWFGDGHPAQNWKPKPDAAVYKAQWDGIDTNGRWQSSLLNYYYRENILYPGLRKANSELFNDCLRKLRAIQPLTEAALEDATQPYALAVARLPRGERSIVFPTGGGLPQVIFTPNVELVFYLPVAEGVALQRAGQLVAALNRYAKVLDVTARTNQRLLVKLLADEPVGQPASASLIKAPDWAASLGDPHDRPGLPGGQPPGCQNPYTRFVLFQIQHCMMALADAAFARGERAVARARYLEVQEIQDLPEWEDVPPLVGGQAYLPNPLLEAYRVRAASGLRKLRLGLSLQGLPLPPDASRGTGNVGLSSLVLPTPYSWRFLWERTNRWGGLAKQSEAEYFAAIQSKEIALKELIEANFTLELATQTVKLRDLGITEASNGKSLALLQAGRSRIELERYNDWLALGDNFYERIQITSMTAASNWRQKANIAETAAAAATSLGSAASGALASAGSAVSFYIGAAVAQGVAGVTRDFAIAQDYQAQLSNIFAGRERRSEEWQLRRDLAVQDGLIGAQGVELAEDRLAIAQQDKVIAVAQSNQAKQMLTFLQNKFTNAEFWDWYVGYKYEEYAFYLQYGASLLRQTEQTLAWTRGEQPQGIARLDYIREASSGGIQDRRGITGSARLLQDLYTLEQYAVSTDRRLLNLTSNFSAARLMPFELEEFRRTGMLPFSIPMSWHESAFPGTYLGLIKRVRISFVALIAPSVGIRATLSSNGLSRIVTADPGYPTKVLQQDPQTVALTSPTGATGVFELDMQSDLNYPFENQGIDTTFFVEMYPAANPTIDFDSLVDVVISLDYTAKFSLELRERVIKTLPRETSGDRVISVRRDLPDVWYELANGQGTSALIALSVGRNLFLPGIENVQIRELSISARTTEGAPCAFAVIPSVTRGAATNVIAPKVVATGGIASSRQSMAIEWRTSAQNQPALLPSPVDTAWRFEISNDLTPGNTTSSRILDQLREGTVDDIIVVIGFAGRNAPWPAL